MYYDDVCRVKAKYGHEESFDSQGDFLAVCEM